MTEPTFLDLSDVETLHDRMLAAYGGLPGTRDRGLLESALGRAENRYAYGDPETTTLFDLAAAYAFGIARNHPFNDANKRTAWATCLAFLDLNGVLLPELVAEAVEAVVRLAQGETDEDGFAAWLREMVQR